MVSAAPFTPSPATAPNSLPRAALALANVQYEKKGSIAYVTVNRPKVLNALNTPTWKDLRTAFEAARDDAAHRRIVPGILERLPQVRPCRGVEGVEDLRAIDRDIGDAVPFLIEDVCERQARLCCRRHVVAPLARK